MASDDEWERDYSSDDDMGLDDNPSADEEDISDDGDDSSDDEDRLWTIVGQEMLSKEPVAALSALVESFSSGQGGDCGSDSIYKAQTLIAFGHEAEPDLDLPPCRAAMSTQFFCIAIESHIYIVGSDCSTLLDTVSFDSNVGQLTLNTSGDYLAAVTAQGCVSIIELSSRKVVWTQDFHDDEDGDLCPVLWIGFLKAAGSATEELLIVLRSMTILRFANIDLQAIMAAAAQHNMEAAMQLKGQITRESVSISPDHLELVRCIQYNGIEDDLIVCGQGPAPLLTWGRSLASQPIEFPVSASDPQPSIVSADVDASGGYLLTLSGDGNLELRVLPYCIPVFSRATDLVDAKIKAVAPGSGAVLISGIIRDQKSSRKYIQFIELPTFRIVNQIEVHANSWILSEIKRCPSTGTHAHEVSATEAPLFSLENDVFFVEGLWDPASNRQIYFVRAISESKPMGHLQTLINEKRFGDAKAFAQARGLPIEVVTKVQLSSLMTSIKSHSQGELACVVQSLLDQLDEVEDHIYCINFCVQAKVPTIDSTYRLLSYARGRSQRIKKSEFTTLTDVAVSSVHHAIHRLGTYQLMLEADNSADQFDAEAWQRFRMTFLATEVSDLLANNQLCQAIVVWRRHIADDDLLEEIADILEYVSMDAPPEEYIAWIKHDIIPNVHRVVEKSRIIAWIERRAIAVEEKDQRPHEAFRLIQLLDDLNSTSQSRMLNFPSVDGVDVLVTPRNYVESSIWRVADEAPEAPPTELKTALEDLVVLSDKHGFYIPLQEYQQTSPAEIALGLLERVSAHELLSGAIRDHFKPYIERHALDSDELLTEYCLEIMNGSLDVAKACDGSWEARVLEILSCMETKGAKLNVLVEVLKRTRVPWSAELEAHIETCLQWTFLRRYEDFKETHMLLRLKRMLLQHGIPNLNVSDLSMGRRVIAVLSTIPPALDIEPVQDGMMVVNTYAHLNKLDVYRARLRYLLQHRHKDQALKLLDTGLENDSTSLPAEARATLIPCSLSTSEAITVLNEIALWLDQKLSQTVRNVNPNGVPTDCSNGASPATDQAQSTFDWVINSYVVVAEYAQKPLRDIAEINQKSSKAEFDTLHWSLHLSQPDLLVKLRSIAVIFAEYRLMLNMDMYENRELHVEILSKIAPQAFTDEHPPHSRESPSKRSMALASSSKGDRIYTKQQVYRLAELLRFPRSNLHSLIAIQAIRDGDLVTAVAISKELYESSTEPAVAELLRDITNELVKHLSQNKISELASSPNFRITSYIKLVVQRSQSLCSASDLPDAIDQYRRLDLLDSIFSQSDQGDYAVLLSEANKAPSGTKRKIAELSQAELHGFHDPVIANIKDDFGSSLFGGHFGGIGLVLSADTSVGHCAQYCNEWNAFHKGSGQDRKRKGNALMPLEQADPLLKHLIQNRSYLTALCLLYSVAEISHRLDAVEGSQLVSENESAFGLVHSLLGEVIAPVHKNMDQSLALACLVFLKEPGWKTFREIITTSSSQAFTRNMCVLGVATAMVLGNTTNEKRMAELSKRNFWFQTLREYGIPFSQKDVSELSKPETKKRVISELLIKSNLDLELAIEFARSHALDEDTVIFEFILHSLKVQSTGYQDFIHGVLENIEDQAGLREFMEHECLDAVSPYDYEAIQFVLHLAGSLPTSKTAASSEGPKPKSHEKSEKLLLVEILQTIARHSTPEVWEAARVLRLQQNGENAAQLVETLIQTYPLCKSRLPYHLLLESPDMTLKAELTETTLSSLVALSIPLKLGTDYFFVHLIDKTLESMRKNTDAPETNMAECDMDDERSALPTQFSFFKPLVTKIKDVNVAIEKCNEIAEQLTNKLEKTNAYRMAFTLRQRSARQNKTTGGDDSKLPVSQNLLRAETINQLDVHSLEQYAVYIDEPEDLVRRLYADKSEEALFNEDRLPLHSVANDICKRYSVDVEALRSSLLKSLIEQDIGQSSGVEELQLPSAYAKIHGLTKSQAESSLQRTILYILRADTLANGIARLTTYAYKNMSARTLTRIRALSVLFLFASRSDLESKHVDYEQARHYMQMLLYLLDFEALHIPVTISTFSKADKEAFVRSLWLNHGPNSQADKRTQTLASQLICNICIDFDIYDLLLWENLLKQLIHFESWHYLLSVLEPISARPQLIQLASLPDSWNQVLRRSLEFATKGYTAEDTKANWLLYRVFSLIQDCLFLPELDSECILRQILSVLKSFGSEADAPLFLLLCVLSVFPSRNLKTTMEEYLCIASPKTVATLVAMVSDPTNAEVPSGPAQLRKVWKGISSKKWILHLLYDSVNEKKAFSHLPARLLVRSAEYYCRQQNITALLQYILGNGRTKEAEQLVAQYYRMHPPAPPLPEQATAETQLERFIRDHGL